MRLTGAIGAAIVVFLVLCPLGSGAGAVEPGEVLSDSVMEQRARAISTDLRCLVCQNQSIDDSDAPLARDLRVLVRDRLKAGDSDVQVIDFVVARYGEFVLLRPRFGATTVLLWGGPLLVLLIAIAAFWRLFGGTVGAVPVASPNALSAAEKRKLKKLIKED